MKNYVNVLEEDMDIDEIMEELEEGWNGFTVMG